MREGKIVRFEEITRCPLEVQDSLLSVLSDRVLAVPELDEGRTVFAREGFNVIATANTRDRGVNEMSAALKRRFNFETVLPIGDIADELALVSARRAGCSSAASIPLRLPAGPRRRCWSPPSASCAAARPRAARRSSRSRAR